MNEYLIPAGIGEAEYNEKRSRFLSHLRCVKSEDEARAFIADMKKEYYDARHNCWCYIIHDGPERYSDDGEPQGTAGIPMLEVFHREGVSDLVCVVTRYFGGVLLGAGGLLRAYTKAAKDSLDEAGIARVCALQCADIQCSYSLADRLRAEVTGNGGTLEDTIYAADVTLKVLIPQESFEAFSSHIYDFTSGKCIPLKTGEKFSPIKIK